MYFNILYWSIELSKNTKSKVRKKWYLEIKFTFLLISERSERERKLETYAHAYLYVIEI